jgi:hypothetical protein
MNRTVIRDPTTEEHETLRHWEHGGKIAWYQRARTILLATDARMDATTIARSLVLHPNTTRRWLHLFDREGLPALAPQPRCHRREGALVVVVPSISLPNSRCPNVRGYCVTATQSKTKPAR